MPSRPASRPRLRFPGSLRWRLTAFVATVMLLMAALSFVVIYVATGSRLESEIDQDLSGDVTQIRASLEPYAAHGSAAVHAAAARYVASTPLSATATLLFVLQPGYAPVSNHPEVFDIGPPEEGEGITTQDAENENARHLRVPRMDTRPSTSPTSAAFGSSSCQLGSGARS